MPCAKRNGGCGSLRAIGKTLAVDTRVEDGRMLVDLFFDQQRIDRTVRCANHVHLAIELNQVPVAILSSDIAGEEPPVANGLGGRCGIVPISLEDGSSFDLEPSSLSASNHDTVSGNSHSRTEWGRPRPAYAPVEMPAESRHISKHRWCPDFAGALGVQIHGTAYRQADAAKRAAECDERSLDRGMEASAVFAQIRIRDKSYRDRSTSFSWV